jgi:ribosome-associated translation inhibitor RaiA
MHQADVYIKGFNKPLRARGMGESFIEALDVVVDKVRRQMAKEKAIIKRHKNYEKSAFGQLEVRLKPRRDWDEAA